MKLRIGDKTKETRDGRALPDQDHASNLQVPAWALRANDRGIGFSPTANQL
eukprot:COSAG02_NODE_49377_length_327_cov_0.771930_1_plen_50_part_10